MNFFRTFVATVALALTLTTHAANSTGRPHIILVMADDMGWGQTGYNGNPVLKTPNLDAMAAAGLRFDRFYAGAPNCSPTRATVLTGRSNDRTGVRDHGYALRLQEKVLPRALRDAGYATAHFGKWHLDGFRGPGVPILASDPHGPGVFGFDEWLSVTNFFDRDPILSHKGVFEERKGDSSEIIVEEALKFIRSNLAGGKPIFTAIWFGSPHSPMVASEADKAAFTRLDRNSAGQYGELVAMDRSIGRLRKGLRDLGIADNTLLWFNSDNGGLPGIEPSSVGGLRGFKNSIYEGGLRVPAIVEWPAVIRKPRVTLYPAGTVDIFPTIADILGLSAAVMLQPSDGLSLKPLFTRELARRDKPLPFRHQGRGAWIDNRYKLAGPSLKAGTFELYDLEADPAEKTDLARVKPDMLDRMRASFLAWNESVEASVAGRDYPAGKVDPADQPPRTWMTAPEYAPYLEQLKGRPEYRQAIPHAAGQEKSP